MEMVIIVGLAIATAVIFFVYGKVSALVDSSTVSHVEKYAKYKPYALIAAKRVEEWARELGSINPNASTTEKSMQKLSMYLSTFNTIVQDAEKTSPTAAVIDAAKEWSIELAEEMNWKNTEKEAKEALNGNITGNDSEVPE
jgi:hypothetical protein